MKKLILVLCLMIVAMPAFAEKKDFELFNATLRFGVLFDSNSSLRNFVNDESYAMAKDINDYRSSQGLTTWVTDENADMKSCKNFELEGRYFYWRYGAGVSIGHYFQSYSADVENTGSVTADFSSTYILATGYVIPVLVHDSHSGYFAMVVLGGGYGYYPAKLAIDAECYAFTSYYQQQINQRYNYQQEYEIKATGWHVVVEGNIGGPVMNLFAGIKYSSVQYDTVEKSGEILRTSQGSDVNPSLKGIELYAGIGVVI